MKYLTLSVFLATVPLGGQSTHAQDSNAFDPFQEEGALFTSAIVTMLWLGAAQGVVESCGSDVSKIGQKFLKFASAAEASQGRDFKRMLAGIFGEGLRMGQGVGCSLDKYRLYEGWADLTYEPLITYFRMNRQ